MYCPYCNAQTNDGANFCPVCGATLTRQPQNQYQQPPQQGYQQPQQNIRYTYPQRPPQANYYQPPKKNSISPVWIVMAVFIIIILSPALIRATRPRNTTTPTTTQITTTVVATQNDASPVEEEYTETIPFEEVYNDKGIIIKTTSFEHSKSKVIVGFYIENNSEMNISVAAHSYSVNNVSINNNIFDMYTDVTKGNKANTKLEISNSDMNNPDDIIKSIKVLFWVYDDDKDFKDFETNIVEIKTSAYGDSIAQITGTNLYKNDDLSVDFVGQTDKSYSFAISNLSTTYFDFDIEGLTINGYTFTGYDFDNIDVCVFNGDQALFTITPEKDFLSDNQITTIENIEFQIEYRVEGTYTDERKTEAITYSVK